MIKVMLVDDEIMAMNYMKSLINWEDYGFEITAMETNGVKALAFLKKEMVDIIFADIRMPGMDGLEFSQKALEINHKLIIILLTSYGDFDYAKKALNIGVSNYLLKHETKAENLIRELENLRVKITEMKQNEKVVIGQLIHKLITFPDSFSQQEKESMDRLLLLHKRNIISYLVILDNPLQFQDMKKNYDGAKVSEESIVHYMDLKFDNMVTIYLRNGQWLVLNIFEPVISQRQILDEIYMAAYGLQRYVFQQYERTVSIIPSPVFNNIEELPFVYRNLKEESGYLVFFDKNKILYGRDITVKSLMEKQKIDSILTEIQSGADKGDLEIILKNIDMFFGISIRNLDRKAFHYFSWQLIQLLIDYSKEKDLEYYEGLMENGLDSIYSASQLHAWFALQFETVIKEMTEKELKQYSPKIREAIKYIFNHYHTDIKIDDVAGSVKVSGEYLRHLFKEEVGKGYNEYLTDLRIQKAKELLLVGKYKLYEIADMIGYSSGTYFSAVFKKITGINPQDYKGENNDEQDTARD